jgi:hypothetical protein
VPAITVEDAGGPERGCALRDSWSIAVHSFPDGVGVGGLDRPGCNAVFDSGDWPPEAGNRLPAVTYELVAADNGVRLFLGSGGSGAGRVDQRLVVRVCRPPPYELRLVSADLGDYRLCPNASAVRRIELRDFRPTAFRRTEERFGFIR